VALFEAMRRQLAVRKARRRAERDPSPTALADLAEVYFELGMRDQAFQSLEGALKRFPDSQLLRSLSAHFHRADFGRQVRSLREQIEVTPEDVNVYLNLARAYMDVADTNRALEAVREGQENRPDSAGLLLAEARIRLERFMRDFAPRDCLGAVSALREALRLEPTYHAAQRLLGQVYYLLGYHQDAGELFKKYVKDNPDDEQVHEWLLAAQNEPGPSEALVLTQAVDEVARRRQFALDLSGHMEVQLGEAPGDRLVGRTLVVEEPAAFEAALAQRLQLRAVLWVGADETRILRTGEGLTEENVLALADVVKTGQRACLDMDIGRLERAVITGPEGALIVMAFANGTLVAFTRERLRHQEADEYLSQALRDLGVLGQGEGDGA